MSSKNGTHRKTLAMQTIALDIEVKDNRPEYADRAPWHILGTDRIMFLDGRWGRARTCQEIIEQAQQLAARYRGASDYTMTLAGYNTLGTGRHVYVPMEVEL